MKLYINKSIEKHVPIYPFPDNFRLLLKYSHSNLFKANRNGEAPLVFQNPQRLISKMDYNKIRNTLFDAACLLIIGEIISLLAGKDFSWVVTIITVIEVVLFFILAFLARKNPYSSVLSALVLFVIISIVTASIKPAYLGGSIIIKIFILIYLVRSISDARELQKDIRSTGRKPE